MDINTPVGEDLGAVGDRARLDAACKRLLSEKRILAWIMKSCLEEYRDCGIREIAEVCIEGQPQVGVVPVAPDETNAARVRGLASEDTSLTEGTVTYDIRFLATVPATDERIQMIVNVEAQGRFDPGYPLIKRGIYYCSRMISAQYGTEFTHSQYQNIKKVCSIWVCLTPPKERRNSITRYRLVEENLVGTVREPVRNYDLLSVVMLCLGGADEDCDGVLRLLDVLFSTDTAVEEKKRILQDDFEIPMTQTLESEVREMCNFSYGFEERGLRKGRAEGQTEERLAAIRNLMDSMSWPAEQAMRALKIPETDHPKYAALLQKQ